MFAVYLTAEVALLYFIAVSDHTSVYSAASVIAAGLVVIAPIHTWVAFSPAAGPMTFREANTATAVREHLQSDADAVAPEHSRQNTALDPSAPHGQRPYPRSREGLFVPVGVRLGAAAAGSGPSSTLRACPRVQRRQPGYIWRIQEKPNYRPNTFLTPIAAIMVYAVALWRPLQHRQLRTLISPAVRGASRMLRIAR